MARHVTEAKTITSLENTYMTKTPGRKRYIAGEKWNYYWYEEELVELKNMWKSGEPIDCIAKHFDRNINEVFIIFLDLAEKGHILERPGGLFGRFERAM